MNLVRKPFLKLKRQVFPYGGVLLSGLFSIGTCFLTHGRKGQMPRHFQISCVSGQVWRAKRKGTFRGKFSKLRFSHQSVAYDLSFRKSIATSLTSTDFMVNRPLKVTIDVWFSSKRRENLWARLSPKSFFPLKVPIRLARHKCKWRHWHYLSAEVVPLERG